MASGNQTAAAARRALAKAVKRDGQVMRKMVRRASVEEEAAALGMSVEDLEDLRADGEDI